MVAQTTPTARVKRRKDLSEHRTAPKRPPKGTHRFHLHPSVWWAFYVWKMGSPVAIREKRQTGRRICTEHQLSMAELRKPDVRSWAAKPPTRRRRAETPRPHAESSAESTRSALLPGHWPWKGCKIGPKNSARVERGRGRSANMWTGDITRSQSATFPRMNSPRGKAPVSIPGSRGPDPRFTGCKSLGQSPTPPPCSLGGHAPGRFSPRAHRHGYCKCHRAASKTRHVNQC